MKLRHSFFAQRERGAAMLDYILASSILFFLTAMIVTTIDHTARGYYIAASATAGGNQSDAQSLTPPRLAPCGNHSSLGESTSGVPIPDECF
jgi:hypothetical protein